RDTDKFELLISHLENGIYFLEILDGVHRGTHRIVKG
ncbi:MAG: hypothetical protein RL040_1501, partial [Bacteroidota bacterium]